MSRHTVKSFSKIKLGIVLLTSLASSGMLAASADSTGKIGSQSMQQGVNSNAFITGRRLKEYTEILSNTDFLEKLKALDAQQTYGDMGAGTGHALADYLSDYPGRAKVVAVGVLEPSALQDNPHALRESKAATIISKFVEEIEDEEIGELDLITDIYGPLSYTNDLSLVLGKYLSWLKINGSLYMHTALKTHVFPCPSGDSCTGTCFYEWLRSIKGVSVNQFNQVDWPWEPVIYVITKTAETLAVPELTCSVYSWHTPPRRSFNRDHKKVE